MFPFFPSPLHKKEDRIDDLHCTSYCVGLFVFHFVLPSGLTWKAKKPNKSVLFKGKGGKTELFAERGLSFRQKKFVLRLISSKWICLRIDGKIKVPWGKNSPPPRMPRGESCSGLKWIFKQKKKETISLTQLWVWLNFRCLTKHRFFFSKVETTFFSEDNS